MAEMLASSLLWRVLLAIGGWFSALAHSSRIFAWLGRTWRASKTRAWLLRRLSASDAPTRESWSAKRFARLNARLAARHGLKDCLDDSVLCRIWRFFVRCGQNSRLFSWLFSDGLHGVILFALSMYVVIDYVLRDLLAVPVLSSCWDECLMLLSLGYVVYERLGRETPLKTGCNPLDLPVCLFITVCFVLMNVVTPYYSIQISGFRATVQYMLWFFLITRLVHNDRDFMRIYLALVILAAVIALHGIYQYIAAVPIPSSWMTHSESSVRTRVYSIFGSPNIMGDFMTMFAPMAAGLAYYTKSRRLQVLAWSCAFCMCFGCLFTMSRGAWMALALAIVIFVLLVDRRLLVLLLAAGCVACTLPFVRSRIGFLFTSDFAEANTSGGRAGRKLVAMTLLEQRGKATGVGLGMFGGAVAMQNQVIDHQEYFYVDNYYLKLMIEMGYTGLAAFLITVLGFLANGCRALYRTAQQKKQALSRLFPLCAGIFAGLCGVFVHCGFENIFEEPYMMAYFWSLAGLLMWAGFLREDKQEVRALRTMAQKGKATAQIEKNTRRRATGTARGPRAPKGAEKRGNRP